MKKFAAMLISVSLLTTACAGCNGSTEPVDPSTWPNEKTINWQISGTAGSSADTLIRSLAQELEPLMGVTIVPGNDYWAPSLRLMMEAAPDGNTLGNVSTPNILTSLVKTENNDDPTYRDVALICGLASSDMCLVLHPDDERFQDVNNLADFVAWCEANPDSNLLLGVKSESSQENVAYHKMMAATGIDESVVTKVNSSNASELMSSFLGYNLDAMIASVAEAVSATQEGTAKVISMFAEERSAFMPEVETAAECGFDVVDKITYGLVMHKDTPQEIQDKYYGFVKQAVNSESFLETIDGLGMTLEFTTGEVFEDYLDEQVEVLSSMRDQLGWT